MLLRAPLLTITTVLLLAAVAFAQPAAPAQSQGSTAPTKYSPPTEILGEGLDSWIKKLDSKDPAVRELAIRSVPLFGESAKKALPKIITMLADNDYTVRLAALLVVTANPIDDEKHRAEIVRRVVDGLIPHGQAIVRLAAAQACTRIGFPAAGAIPSLIGEYHLKNQLSYEARKAAAEALGMVGQPNPKDPTSGPDRRAIIALMGSLSDSCLAVRIEAAQSLLFLGAPAQPADLAKEKEELLKRIVAEPDKVLSMWLRVCLMRLDPTLVNSKNLDPIAANLLSGQHHVRVAAADALGMMGPAAATKAGDLREGLKYAKSEKPEDMEFLAKCLIAIGFLGKDASFLKNEVLALSNHPNETIKLLVKDTVDKLDGKMPQKPAEKK